MQEDSSAILTIQEFFECSLVVSVCIGAMICFCIVVYWQQYFFLTHISDQTIDGFLHFAGDFFVNDDFFFVPTPIYIIIYSIILT